MILAIAFTAQKVESYSFDASDVHPYYNAIPINTQSNIRLLSADQNLSYELVISIFYVENITDYKFDKIKSRIETYAFYRDYWVEQKYPDEIVFELMLLSIYKENDSNRGFIMYDESSEMDDYLQKVLEYKCYLEQNLDNLPYITEISKDADIFEKNLILLKTIKAQKRIYILLSSYFNPITVNISHLFQEQRF
jgi:hypothetical protein